VHSLAQRVLSHIRRQELLRAGDRVGVAVSGGIDSVALLRLLIELRSEPGIVLSVVHFNHKLRGAESDADQEFVAALAREHHLEFHTDSDDVAQHAAEERVSLETAARELRYGFFQYLLSEGDRPQGLKPDSGNPILRGAEAPLFHVAVNSGAKLDKIVTGHTLDDQAETVLMRMIRGAGMKGLGGIHPRIQVETCEVAEVEKEAEEETKNDYREICGEIVRPLLAFRHAELEQYLNQIGQPWREDATNADPSFTRNRVRKLLVPLLEREFNPSIAENLAELAEIARGEEDYWENEIAGWMGTAVHWTQPDWTPTAAGRETGLVQIAPVKIEQGGSSPSDLHSPDLHSEDLHSKIAAAPWLVMNASVDRLWFLGEPVAVQRRLVKAIGEQARIPLEFKHVEEILRRAAARDGSGKELSLPLGWKLVLEPHAFVFVTPALRDQTAPQDYEYFLPVPGQTSVPEAGFTLEARRIPAAAAAEYNPDNLLNAESLPGPLTVRNWRPGDRFWPAHTKSPKKIKELLLQRQVARPERRLWPVIVRDIALGQDKLGRDDLGEDGSEAEIVWMRGFPTPAKFRPKPGSDAILIVEK
jgi:tRNA(Ile)-lysidine synthase